ncbi:toll/interleukin-1 receptor domain-containing protein [Aliiglaciecola lipolytica]|uniref:toll/interleukin-1 receptor domain-containing protein n=1 Tax=Aliiglaciecola lipolytica TaxID=477689 RepID=UPI001C0939FC|nr:toll/interleukin-1 receptor domain-containing protein [Aliiglaciecola lipolytica]MBU2879667.1 TIR domain-containing protein [Aliiglaciecola lipolytica]
MQYSAFISYSHKDEKLARWLMRKLEAYRVPAKLIGQSAEFGVVPRRIGKIFRDRDELPTAGNLGQRVNQALQNSSSLIVICSPFSAKSKWVNTEITEFRKMGREERILCFIADGDPMSCDPEIACFPPALLKPAQAGQPNREPLAADARMEGDGKDRAFLKLVAGLLGVGFDSLAQRDAQRRYKRLALISVGSFAGMAFASALAITAVIARNDAQRRQDQAEDIVGFMLGDLRERLQTVGRLDLMRSVDDKATSYFSKLNKRDLSDRALAEQARSLTGIGEVRLNEGDYQLAMAAFAEAYERSKALHERDASNGIRLFDLSQAEYWLGNVAWQQGRLDDAEKWLIRYRDSAIRLAAMDSNNPDWQIEAAYGYQNLAILDKSRGNFEQAKRAMLEVRNLYVQWAEQAPDNLQLRYDMANASSWLGSLALQQGRFNEAKNYFEEQNAAIKKNIKEEPDNIIWKEDFLYANRLLASVSVHLGDVEEATKLYITAKDIAEQLFNQDPQNAYWMLDYGRCLWQLALMSGRSAKQHLQQAEKLIEKAYNLKKKEERTLQFYGDLKVAQSEFALLNGQIDLALHYIEQFEQNIEPAWHNQEMEKTEDFRLVYSRGLILKGKIAFKIEQQQTAQQYWQQALALLTETELEYGVNPKPDKLPFTRLIELTTVLSLLGDDQQLNIHQKRLNNSGYIAFTPFLVD